MSQGQSTHRIERQILEIEVADQEEGRRLQSTLSRLQRQRLNAIIERALDRLAGPETIVRLDRVTIELGEIEDADLEGAIAESLGEHLPRELAKSVARCEEENPGDARFDRDHPRSACEELDLFARTGTLPWTSAPSDARHLHRRVETLLQISPEALATTLRRLINTPRAIERIAAHFSEKLLAKLVDLLLSPARLRPLRAVDGDATTAAAELSDGLASSGDLDALTGRNAHRRQVLVWRGLLVAAGRPRASAEPATLDTYTSALVEISRATGASTSATRERLSRPDPQRKRAPPTAPRADSTKLLDLAERLDHFARSGQVADADRLRQPLRDLLTASARGTLAPILRPLLSIPGAASRIAANFSGELLAMIVEELLSPLRPQPSAPATTSTRQTDPLSLARPLTELPGLQSFSLRGRERLAWQGLLKAAAGHRGRHTLDPQALTRSALESIARETGRSATSLQGTSQPRELHQRLAEANSAGGALDTDPTPGARDQGQGQEQEQEQEQEQSRPQRNDEHDYSADESTVIEAIREWAEIAATAVTIINPSSAPQGSPPSDAARVQLRNLIGAMIALGRALESAPKVSAQALLLAHHATSPIRRECAQFSLLALGAGAGPKMSKETASAIAKGLEEILSTASGSAHSSPSTSTEKAAPPPPKARTLASTGTPKPSGPRVDTPKPVKATLLSSPKPTPKPSPTDELAPEMTDTEAIHVDDAGLVLLWPFLPHLFAHVGLVEGPTFRDADAQLRAAALLRVAAGGDVDVAEYQLPLAKLLCGLELSAVYDLDPPVQEAESQECTRMLEALIARATILKDMSVGGLRGSFLLRPGILSVRDNGWLLKVERRPYDLVLDRFPWAFEWVKLPWMSAPVQVEW